jgi:retinol dehydrogenase 12
MQGKSVIITGAAGGLGAQAAAELARQGAHVLLVARSEARCQDAKREVEACARHRAIDTLAIDTLAIELSALSEIRRGASELLKRYPKIDVLINNAGLYSHRQKTSGDGLELTFAVNHLASFLLTLLLLPALRAAGHARIINVSSIAHRSGRMHWDDVMMGKGYDGFRAYAQSKLANVLFTRELASRLQDARVTANAAHPGFVATGILRELPWIIRKPAALFMRSPESGAEPLVWLASDPGLVGSSGIFFDRMTRMEPSPAAQDRESARRLWELSAKLVSLPPSLLPPAASSA